MVHTITDPYSPSYHHQQQEHHLQHHQQHLSLPQRLQLENPVHFVASENTLDALSVGSNCSNTMGHIIAVEQKHKLVIVNSNSNGSSNNNNNNNNICINHNSSNNNNSINNNYNESSCDLGVILDDLTVDDQPSMDYTDHPNYYFRDESGESELKHTSSLHLHPHQLRCRPNIHDHSSLQSAKTEPLTVIVQNHEDFWDSATQILSPPELSVVGVGENSLGTNFYQTLPSVVNDEPLSPPGFSPTSAYDTLTPLQPLPPISTISEKFAYGGHTSGGGVISSSSTNDGASDNGANGNSVQNGCHGPYVVMPTTHHSHNQHQHSQNHHSHQHHSNTLGSLSLSGQNGGEPSPYSSYDKLPTMGTSMTPPHYHGSSPSHTHNNITKFHTMIDHYSPSYHHQQQENHLQHHQQHLSLPQRLQLENPVHFVASENTLDALSVGSNCSNTMEHSIAVEQQHKLVIVNGNSNGSSNNNNNNNNNCINHKSNNNNNNNSINNNNNNSINNNYNKSSCDLGAILNDLTVDDQPSMDYTNHNNYDSHDKSGESELKHTSSLHLHPHQLRCRPYINDHSSLQPAKTEPLTVIVQNHEDFWDSATQILSPPELSVVGVGKKSLGTNFYQTLPSVVNDEPLSPPGFSPTSAYDTLTPLQPLPPISTISEKFAYGGHISGGGVISSSSTNDGASDDGAYGNSVQNGCHGPYVVMPTTHHSHNQHQHLQNHHSHQHHSNTLGSLSLSGQSGGEPSPYSSYDKLPTMGTSMTPPHYHGSSPSHTHNNITKFHTMIDHYSPSYHHQQQEHHLQHHQQHLSLPQRLQLENPIHFVASENTLDALSVGSNCSNTMEHSIAVEQQHKLVIVNGNSNGSSNNNNNNNNNCINHKSNNNNNNNNNSINNNYNKSSCDLGAILDDLTVDDQPSMDYTDHNNYDSHDKSGESELKHTSSLHLHPHQLRCRPYIHDHSSLQSAKTEPLTVIVQNHEDFWDSATQILSPPELSVVGVGKKSLGTNFYQTLPSVVNDETLSPPGFSPTSAYDTLTPLQPLPPISTISEKFAYGGHISGGGVISSSSTNDGASDDGAYGNSVQNGCHGPYVVMPTTHHSHNQHQHLQNHHSHQHHSNTLGSLSLSGQSGGEPSPYSSYDKLPTMGTSMTPPHYYGSSPLHTHNNITKFHTIIDHYSPSYHHQQQEHHLQHHQQHLSLPQRLQLENSVHFVASENTLDALSVGSNCSNTMGHSIAVEQQHKLVIVNGNSNGSSNNNNNNCINHKSKNNNNNSINNNYNKSSCDLGAILDDLIFYDQPSMDYTDHNNYDSHDKSGESELKHTSSLHLHHHQLRCRPNIHDHSSLQSAKTEPLTVIVQNHEDFWDSATQILSPPELSVVGVGENSLGTNFYQTLPSVVNDEPLSPPGFSPTSAYDTLTPLESLPPISTISEKFAYGGHISGGGVISSSSTNDGASDDGAYGNSVQNGCHGPYVVMPTTRHSHSQHQHSQNHPSHQNHSNTLGSLSLSGLSGGEPSPYSSYDKLPTMGTSMTPPHYYGSSPLHTHNNITKFHTMIDHYSPSYHHQQQEHHLQHHQQQLENSVHFVASENTLDALSVGSNCSNTMGHSIAVEQQHKLVIVNGNSNGSSNNNNNNNNNCINHKSKNNNNNSINNNYNKSSCDLGAILDDLIVYDQPSMDYTDHNNYDSHDKSGESELKHTSSLHLHHHQLRCRPNIHDHSSLQSAKTEPLTVIVQNYEDFWDSATQILSPPELSVVGVGENSLGTNFYQTLPSVVNDEPLSPPRFSPTSAYDTLTPLESLPPISTISEKFAYGGHISGGGVISSSSTNDGASDDGAYGNSVQNGCHGPYVVMPTTHHSHSQHQHSQNHPSHQNHSNTLGSLSLSGLSGGEPSPYSSYDKLPTMGMSMTTPHYYGSSPSHTPSGIVVSCDLPATSPGGCGAISPQSPYSQSTDLQSPKSSQSNLLHCKILSSSKSISITKDSSTGSVAQQRHVVCLSSININGSSIVGDNVIVTDYESAYDSQQRDLVVSVTPSTSSASNTSHVDLQPPSPVAFSRHSLSASSINSPSTVATLPHMNNSSSKGLIDMSALQGNQQHMASLTPSPPPQNIGLNGVPQNILTANKDHDYINSLSGRRLMINSSLDTQLIIQTAQQQQDSKLHPITSECSNYGSHQTQIQNQQTLIDIQPRTKHGNSNPANSNCGDMEEINTKELTERISAELKYYSIPQAIFAQHVLGRSQGTFSVLLRNPKPWSKLQNGRETFQRMFKWLQEPESQRISALRMAAAQLPQHSSCTNNGNSTINHIVNNSMHDDFDLDFSGPASLGVTKGTVSARAMITPGVSCHRKDEPQMEYMPQPKKPRLEFSDLQ